MNGSSGTLVQRALFAQTDGPASHPSRWTISTNDHFLISSAARMRLLSVECSQCYEVGARAAPGSATGAVRATKVRADSIPRGYPS